MTHYLEVLKEIKSLENEKEAQHSMHFFKTGKGEYGEGDLFLGLTSLQIKAIAKKYFKELSLLDIEKLLQDPYHDVRCSALSMLVLRFETKSKVPLEQKLMEQKEIYKLYLRNVEYINNWDLVDISCYKIVGRYVFENGDDDVFDKLANSGHLWSERISVVSNMYLVKRGEFKKLKELAIKFLNHKHDLMHKAVGWLLREMGKKDEAELCTFLDEYSKVMPRTALRYSIEKLSPQMRQHYMGK